MGATDIIKEIKEHQDIYLAFVGSDEKLQDFSQKYDLSKNCISAISRLKSANMPGTTLPFIFNLFSEFKHEKITQELLSSHLETIESFLVRRAICGYEPTGLHALFKDLYDKARESGGFQTSKTIIAIIDKNPTVNFPDDEEFISAIIEKNLYSRKIAKYAIIEYENGFDGDTISHSQPMTIDHIMPQNPSHWDVEEDEHEKYHNTWGNLVPLSSPTNSKKGNRNWDVAKSIYQDETIYRSPKIVAKSDSWTTSSITKRSNDIALWACQRWSKQS